jgi:predicted metalloprotease with PDZ domain
LLDLVRKMRISDSMTKTISQLTLGIASIALTAALNVALPAFAQNSAPEPLAIVSTIPDPVDTPLTAPMKLDVDATDIMRAIFRAKQTIPVDLGKPLILLYPEWLPGKHGPRGAIAEMTGLMITANGKPVKWTRDPVEVFAFHVDVPAGAKEVQAEFQFTTPLRGSEGRVVMTQEMMNIQWEQISFYPAGHYTRAIRIKPSVTLPQGWTGIAALDGGKVTGNRIDYAETDYETFIDSPLFAGRHYKKWDLGYNVTLNVWADEAKFLEAKPEHIATHKAMVEESVILFGAKHYDRYEFLLGLTSEMGGIGLEHHRSSENTLDPKTFTEWDKRGSERGLLPHEFVHSWNGKFRRSDAMFTPDYRMPMRDNLLWVYEGQTSYWDSIIAARSGVQTKEVVLADWARSAAFYSIQPGRKWRSVEDTTHDPIFAARKPKPNSSWARGEDYYNESALIWLEADILIRQGTKGKKSLDDFAKAFFGLKEGDWGTVTYNFEEVVRTLNGVYPYDWATFLDTRVRQPGQAAPLGGIEKGGYKLVFKDTPNIVDKERAAENGGIDLTYSLGMTADKTGKVTSTIWDGPAFSAGVVTEAQIVAVDGLSYTADRLTDAIKLATDGKTPIKLLILRDKRYKNVEISYSGGVRYPHLEAVGTGEKLLDTVMKARRK